MMKNKIGIMLLFPILLSFGCSNKNSNQNTVECKKKDSIKSIIKNKNSSQLDISADSLSEIQEDYYDKLENGFKKEYNLSDDEVVEFIDSLMDVGLLTKPTIIKRYGYEAKTFIVDYKLYKEYLKDTINRRMDDVIIIEKTW